MKVLSLLVSASLASISLPLMASDAAVDNTLEIKVQNSINQLCSSITSTTGKEIKRDALGNYILTAGEHAVNNYLCTVSENKASDKLYIYQIEQHKVNWYASSDYQGHDNWKKNLQANQKALDISKFIDSNNWLALSNQNGIIRLGFKTNVQRQNRYAIKVHNNTAENFKNCQIKLNNKVLSFAELLPKHVTNLSVEYDENVNLIELSCDVNSKELDIFITGGSKHDREYKWSKNFAKTHYYTLHKESHSTPKGQLYDINVNVYQKNTSKANLLMQKSSAPYFTDMTNIIQLLPGGGTITQMFNGGYSLFRILTGQSVSPFNSIVTNLTNKINEILNERDLATQKANVQASINGNRTKLDALERASTDMQKVHFLVNDNGYLDFLSNQLDLTVSGTLENANSQIIKLWSTPWSEGRYLKSILKAQIALVAQKLFLYKMKILNLAYVSKYYKAQHDSTNLETYSCDYKSAVDSLDSYIDDTTSGLASVINRVNAYIGHRTANGTIYVNSTDGGGDFTVSYVDWGASIRGAQTFWLFGDTWKLYDAMGNDKKFWSTDYFASYSLADKQQDVRNRMSRFRSDNQQYWVSDLQEMKRQLESYKQLAQELIDKTRDNIRENRYCGVTPVSYSCTFSPGIGIMGVYQNVSCTPAYNGQSLFTEGSGCFFHDWGDSRDLVCLYANSGPLYKKYGQTLQSNLVNCSTDSGAPVCTVEL